MPREIYEISGKRTLQLNMLSAYFSFSGKIPDFPINHRQRQSVY